METWDNPDFFLVIQDNLEFQNNIHGELSRRLSPELEAIMQIEGVMEYSGCSKTDGTEATTRSLETPQGCNETTLIPPVSSDSTYVSLVIPENLPAIELQGALESRPEPNQDHKELDVFVDRVFDLDLLAPARCGSNLEALSQLEIPAASSDADTLEQNSHDKGDDDPPKAPSDDSTRKRAKRKFVPDEAKDETYWEKRARNNEAARKSRATARKKINLDQAGLKNSELKRRYISLRIEQEKLKCDAILLGLDLAKLTN